MNIVCEKCNTVYRFDASKIPPGGKKVKCSNCQHIFVARPREEAAARMLELDLEPGDAIEGEVSPEREAEAVPGGEEGDKRKHRLLLRQDSTRYAVQDLATLQRWIVERRVTRDAELSMDGEVWEKVSERMDLLPFFTIVDKSRKKKGAKRDAAADINAPERRGPRGGKEEGPGGGLRVATTLQATASEVVEALGPASEVSLDPALEAATRVDGAAPVKTNLSPAASAATHDDRQAPVLAMNGVSPASHAPIGTPSSGIPAPVAHPTAAPGGGGSAAKVIYGVAILALLAGLGYFLQTRMTGTPGPGGAVADGPSQPEPVAPGPQSGEPGPAVGLPPQNVPAVAVDPVVAGPGPAPMPADAAPAPVAPAPESVPAGRPALEQSATREAPQPPPSEPVVKHEPAPAVQPPPKAEPARSAAETPPKAEPTARKESPAKSPEPPPAEAPVARALPTDKPIVTPSGSTGKLIQAGRSYVRNHKYEEAVATLTKAAEQSPTNPVVYKELGWALMNLADASYTRRTDYQNQAADALRKAIGLNSRYAEAYHLLGVMNKELGQKTEAAKNLRAALQFGLKGDDATEARSFLQQLEGEGVGSN